MSPADGTSTSPDAPRACACVPAIPADVAAVVMDFDGTLADTAASHEHVLRAALEPYGVDLDHRWYRDRIGLSIHDLLDALPGHPLLPHEEIIGQSRAHLLATVHTLTPIVCVVSLLHAARRGGLPCAVASGASRVLVQPGLEALGLTREFVAVVAREDVARGKPAPDLFAEAARRVDVAPKHCLAVDDAPDGVIAARAAGMRILTVLDGHLAATGDNVAPASRCAETEPTPTTANPAPAPDSTKSSKEP